MPEWVGLWLSDEEVVICNGADAVPMCDCTIVVKESTPEFIYNDLLSKRGFVGDRLVASLISAFLILSTSLVYVDEFLNNIEVVHASLGGLQHLMEITLNAVDFIEAIASGVGIVVFKWN
jgi:hypothetical protein